MACSITTNAIAITTTTVTTNIPMTRCINDRVMIWIRKELSGAALDRHTTSPLIFAFVHEKSKQKGFLSQFLSLLLQFRQISIAHTAQLEQQTTRCRRLAGIDVAHNHQTQMRFAVSHDKECWSQRRDCKRKDGTWTEVVGCWFCCFFKNTKSFELIASGAAARQ